MRILQIYELNPLESIGGVEFAILQLSKELTRLGHEVTILTGGRSGEVLHGRLRVISVDFLGTMKRSCSQGHLTPLRQILFLSSLLPRRLEQYDVYHGHIYTSGLLAHYLAKKHNGVAVNTIHGSYYPVWDKLTNPLSACLYRTAERLLAAQLARRTLQIHASTYFADCVRAWGGKVKVIPNGVDASVFHPGVECSILCPLPIILTARRLVRKNGIEYLIKAMEYIKDQCKLLIIGDGPERQKLEILAKRAGNIEFMGAVPHEKMPSCIAGADIAVVPSIIEASSLFMLEAMAMGKPVVASAVGGLPEILGDSGILVTPMHPRSLVNAIMELLHDPVKRRRLGSSARRRVEENFTWQKIAMQIENEYLHLWNTKNT